MLTLDAIRAVLLALPIPSCGDVAKAKGRPIGRAADLGDACWGGREQGGDAAPEICRERRAIDRIRSGKGPCTGRMVGPTPRLFAEPRERWQPTSPVRWPKWYPLEDHRFNLDSTEYEVMAKVDSVYLQQNNFCNFRFRARFEPPSRVITSRLDT